MEDESVTMSHTTGAACKRYVATLACDATSEVDHESKVYGLVVRRSAARNEWARRRRAEGC